MLKVVIRMCSISRIAMNLGRLFLIMAMRKNNY